jgi:hypothetical protein
MSRRPAWSSSEDKDWIPLFDGEKQQKPLFPAPSQAERDLASG